MNNMTPTTKEEIKVKVIRLKKSFTNLTLNKEYKLSSYDCRWVSLKNDLGHIVSYVNNSKYFHIMTDNPNPQSQKAKEVETLTAEEMLIKWYNKINQMTVYATTSKIWKMASLEAIDDYAKQETATLITANIRLSEENGQLDGMCEALRFKYNNLLADNQALKAKADKWDELQIGTDHKYCNTCGFPLPNCYCL